MGAPMIVMKKNKLDISTPDVVLTASEANEFVDFLRNRKNTSGWITSGSLDANNTTIEVDFVNSVDLQIIILILHNFKSYTIKYWDGFAYQDFSTAINVSANTDETTHHTFDLVTTTKILLTITGTMTVDDDKTLAQFIATEYLKSGVLNGFPEIKSPTISRNKVRSKMLSGKESIKEQIGATSLKLALKVYSDADDLEIFEAMYQTNDGFLLWICGGDETQFSSLRIGYRKQDLPLLKCSDEYQPEWYKSIYVLGQVVNMDLVEVID